MRAVVQRVSHASVEVSGEGIASIGPGLLVLVAAAEGDGPEDLQWIGRKLCGLRIFPDAAGKMNLSVIQAGGSILVVSQFTLCGDVSRGMRPSFTTAMEPGRASAMINELVRLLRERVVVETGCFGADMKVALTNDGPVTLWLDSRNP
ncbi:MAG: D-aminoacyl-tRNA deacylase [Myxococcota bacterium]